MFRFFSSVFCVLFFVFGCGAGAGTPGVQVSGSGGTATGSTVSVKDFGAKGDGSTDDTQAFQNALRYIRDTLKGGTLVIPPGTYPISGYLQEFGDNTTVLGQEGSVLKMNYWGRMFYIVGRNNVKLVNLTIDGNKDNIAAGADFAEVSCILTHNVSNFEVSGCHIRDWITNLVIAARAGSNARIENNSIVNSGKPQPWWSNTFNATCIDVTSWDGAVVSGNTVKNCNDTYIAIGDSKNVTVSGNRLELDSGADTLHTGISYDAHGISVGGDISTGFSDGITITGNIIKSSHPSYRLADGVNVGFPDRTDGAGYLNRHKNIFISGNVIENAYNCVAVEAAVSDGLTVDSNVLSSCVRGFAFNYGAENFSHLFKDNTLWAISSPVTLGDTETMLSLTSWAEPYQGWKAVFDGNSLADDRPLASGQNIALNGSFINGADGWSGLGAQAYLITEAGTNSIRFTPDGSPSPPRVSQNIAGRVTPGWVTVSALVRISPDFKAGNLIFDFTGAGLSETAITLGQSNPYLDCSKVGLNKYIKVMGFVRLTEIPPDLSLGIRLSDGPTSGAAFDIKEITLYEGIRS